MSETEDTGTAAAVDPAQATAPEGAGGAAPETQYQRRKRLQDEKNAERAKRSAARKAKKAGKPAAASSDEPAQPGKPPAEERDDKERAREGGGFWRLTLRVVGWVLYPFGRRLAPLTKEEFAEDVACLVPLMKRHTWLDVTARYVALPVLLLERIATKVEKREPKKTDAPAP